MLKLFSRNQDAKQSRALKKYYKMVDRINKVEQKYEKMSDEELRAKTDEFKQLLHSGKTIHDIKIEAFAVVREASKRILGMRHYDVQLIGGLVLAEGNIAEMATGEGKTLVASLPSYLRALEGKGVHVITVNDYLARRDWSQIGQIHQFLGLSVGLNVPEMDPEDKHAAYNADITYGVGTEFGFDYLRDNMQRDLNHKVQRPYHYAIIDEVDSVLIDEAKTPLIVAGKTESHADLHYIAAKLAKRFKKDEDYDFDDETKATSLTDTGIDKVEKAFGIDNLYDLSHHTLYHYVIQAVRAHVMFERDVDYIVHEGKVQLVDMFTGRIMEGRTLSDGLHQAIEAKEGLEITEENKTQAQVTVQNYFRMYPILSGMTGTAKTEEKEFQHVYGMDVVPIPTNRTKIREDMPDLVFEKREQKYEAMLKEVKHRHEKGQPVLIGTTSIRQSEDVAEYLDKESLRYEILNAKTVEQEVELISQAGQKGHITIATNMAGRGTDILLGEGVKELGGLHVLGTEKHESRRIDNQLRGRAGRQGDPGSSQFFISLEDDMFRRFAKEELEKLQPKLKTRNDGIITNKNIHEFVERVQRIVEGANFAMREYNLKLDDVINEQRNIIYGLRDKIMESDQCVDLLKDMTKETVEQLIEEACPKDKVWEEWNLEGLQERLSHLLQGELKLPGEPEDQQIVKDAAASAVGRYLDGLDQYKDHEEANQVFKSLMLSYIDLEWVKHLESMIHLKEGIGLRHYQQEDPMRIYAREGLELFTSTYFQFEKNIAVSCSEYISQME